MRDVDKGFRLLRVPKLVSSVLCPSYPSRSAVIVLQSAVSSKNVVY
jgi:hypothetical protein